MGFLMGRSTQTNSWRGRARMINIDWSFYPILDKTTIGDKPLKDVAIQLLEGGARVIQLRDKVSSLREFYQQALELRRLTKDFQVPLIINDRLDVALAVEADGLHLGQEDLPLRVARRLLGEEKIIGVSVRNLDQAQRAFEQGADYLGVGSIFPTSTKKDTETVGVELIKKIKESINLPLIAIGGITLDNLDQIFQAGADGVAVISDLLKVKNIKNRTRAFAEKIQKLKGT